MAETRRAAAPACAQLKRKAADKAAPALNHNAGADAASVALSPAEIGVATALSQCSSAAETCLSMCIEHLAVGNTEMAECARTVRDVLALCEASKVLIGARSPFTNKSSSFCAGRLARLAGKPARNMPRTTPNVAHAGKTVSVRSRRSIWFSLGRLSRTRLSMYPRFPRGRCPGLVRSPRRQRL